jgi:hypothetical protein
LIAASRVFYSGNYGGKIAELQPMDAVECVKELTMSIYKLSGVTASVTILVCALSMASLNAKEHSAKHKDGDPFDQTGTVTKNEVDNCMQGDVKFLLHAGKENDRLSPKSRMDHKVLGDAEKSGGKVHVTGTWKPGVEPNCDYVVTAKCEPIKK